MKQVDVVVLGRNYSTSLGLIQAAGEAGYIVGAVHSTEKSVGRRPLELRSKYVKKSLIITNRSNEKELVSTLINNFSSSKEKVVLLPSDDYSVCAIDKNIHELERYFIVPNVCHKTGEIIKCMDKNVQASMAVEAGLHTAKCWEVNIDGTNEPAVPSSVIYPCMIKPLRSVGAPKTYIRQCESKDDLEKALREIQQNKPCSILIEEFINIEKEYTIPILAIGNEVIIPAFLKKNRVGAGTHKGVTIFGTVLSSARYPEIVESMKKMVRRAGLNGIFDIELFESNGEFFFNELNLRNGAAGYALTRAGVNLPALWVDFCYGKHPSVEKMTFKEGLTFVSDKAAIENYRAGYMNWREYRNTVQSADFRFLVDSGDSAIKCGFKRIEIRTILSKIIKG